MTSDVNALRQHPLGCCHVSLPNFFQGYFIISLKDLVMEPEEEKEDELHAYAFLPSLSSIFIVPLLCCLGILPRSPSPSFLQLYFFIAGNFLIFHHQLGHIMCISSLCICTALLIFELQFSTYKFISMQSNPTQSQTNKSLNK